MIKYRELYLDYIKRRGVGANDQVADSRKSYVQYLEGVSRVLGLPVSPQILRTGDDVENIVRRLDGQRSPNTIKNYRSAMRRYVEMVRDEGL